MKKKWTKLLVAVLVSTLVATSMPVNLLEAQAQQNESNVVNEVVEQFQVEEDVETEEEIGTETVSEGDEGTVTTTWSSRGVDFTVYDGDYMKITGVGTSVDGPYCGGMSGKGAVTEIYCDFIPYAKGANLDQLFSFFPNVEKITFGQNFVENTSNIVNMRRMFKDCTKLSTLDLSGWDVSNVTNMSYLFNNCTSLTSIDTTGWKTGSLVYMDEMFSGCTSFQSADFLKTWDVSKVETMKSLLNGCTSLTSVDLSGWQTDSLVDIGYLFNGCSSLTSLNVSGWNTSNVNGMDLTFAGCTSLTSLDLSSWNTSNMTRLYSAFSGNTNLTNLNVSGWDTSNVTTTQGLFSGCSSLVSLDLSSWDWGSINSANVNQMFVNCSSIHILKTPYNNACGYSLDGINVNGWNFRILNGVTVDETTAYYSVPKGQTESLFLVRHDNHNWSDYVAGEDGLYVSACSICGAEQYKTDSAFFTYKINDDKESASITGYAGTSTKILIPENIDGYTITAIAQNAFKDNAKITSVVIPDTVTTIEANAFCGCSNLAEIVFSESVTFIGVSAFAECDKLTYVKLPAKLEKLHAESFGDCANLTTVEIPKSIQQGGTNNGPFAGCDALKTVIFEEGITEIPGYILRNTGVEKIEIPDTVTTIGKYAFDGCGNLTEIVFPESVTVIDIFAFAECDKLTSVELPSKLEVLRGNAFGNCANLSTIEIPKSIQQDGTSNGPFTGCDKLKTVIFEEGITEIPGYLFRNTGLESIVIPDTVTTIGIYAFKECTELTEITMLRNVVEIGKDAFTYPTAMTVYGYTDSYAENYAYANGMNFVDIGIHADEIILPEVSYIMEIGSTMDLDVTVSPGDCTDIISYESEDETIATVDANGRVRAMEVGNTTIVISAGRLEKRCSINVIIPATSVELDKTSLNLDIYETEKLVAIIKPDNATIKDVKWSSSNEDVAVVTDEGVVTAFATGECQITATTVDGSEKIAVCNVTVSDVEYTMPVYTIIFENNSVDADGTMESQEITYESGEKLAANQYTRLGYTSAGWNTESDGTGISYADRADGSLFVLEEGENTIFLYAQWIPHKYNVTFAGNGADSGMMFPMRGCEYDKAYSLTNNTFTRTGYHFKGWNTKADGNGNYYNDGASFANMTADNGVTITLYAQWQPIIYDVVLHGNGHTSGSMDYWGDLVYDTVYTIPNNAYTRTGYTFIGWNTKADGSGVTYANMASIKNLSSVEYSQVVLYAQWKANTYNVKFNANGGKGKMSTLTNVIYGKSVKLKKNTFTRKGYTFAGWNTKKNGKGITYKNKASIKNLTAVNKKTITLYAQWKPVSYKITYNLNGGKNHKSNPKKYTVATKSITLKKPTRKGYTFKGWYSDKKLTKKVTKIKKGSTGNIKLYAKWVKK